MSRISSARSSRANDNAVKEGRRFGATLAVKTIRVNTAGKRLNVSERLLVTVAIHHLQGISFFDIINFIN